MSLNILNKMNKEDLVDYFISLQQLSHVLLRSNCRKDLILKIVMEAVEFLKADGGSLYLCKEPGLLTFESIYNKSFDLESRPKGIPLKTESIATYCFNQSETVNVNDVYMLTDEAPFKFNSTMDKKIGYRTRSVLAAPLVSETGTTIGVLQVFNKKNYQSEKWPTDNSEIDEMPLFDLIDIEIIKIIAELASAAVENLETLAKNQEKEINNDFF